MQILTIDCETTTFNKGNPFDRRNKLCMTGLKFLGKYPRCYIIHDRPTVDEIEDTIAQSDILVGFNIKFDLHWMANVGVDLSCIKRVWDCQIGEFLLESQQNRYPSLNEALEKYGLPLKLDVVKTEYWDKGIDTDQIPVHILQEYLEGDLLCTEGVFKRQYGQFTGKQI